MLHSRENACAPEASNRALTASHFPRRYPLRRLSYVAVSFPVAFQVQQGAVVPFLVQSKSEIFLSFYWILLKNYLAEKWNVRYFRVPKLYFFFGDFLVPFLFLSSYFFPPLCLLGRLVGDVLVVLWFSWWLSLMVWIGFYRCVKCPSDVDTWLPRTASSSRSFANSKHIVNFFDSFILDIIECNITSHRYYHCTEVAPYESHLCMTAWGWNSHVIETRMLLKIQNGISVWNFWNLCFVYSFALVLVLYWSLVYCHVFVYTFLQWFWSVAIYMDLFPVLFTKRPKRLGTEVDAIEKLRIRLSQGAIQLISSNLLVTVSKCKLKTQGNRNHIICDSLPSLLHFVFKYLNRYRLQLIKKNVSRRLLKPSINNLDYIWILDHKSTIRVLENIVKKIRKTTFTQHTIN